MDIREIGRRSSKDKIRNLVLPGFDGIPISHVITFVLKGFRKGVLVTRASSIAFNLLMALLPASIFLFTLIPFVPISTIVVSRKWKAFVGIMFSKSFITSV